MLIRQSIVSGTTYQLKETSETLPTNNYSWMQSCGKGFELIDNTEH